jgi:hypothetical protein
MFLLDAPIYWMAAFVLIIAKKRTGRNTEQGSGAGTASLPGGAYARVHNLFLIFCNF